MRGVGQALRSVRLMDGPSGKVQQVSRLDEDKGEGVSGEGVFLVLCRGCEFQFCEKKDTGKRIIEILGGTD